jgi:hypothetical protein
MVLHLPDAGCLTFRDALPVRKARFRRVSTRLSSCGLLAGRGKRQTALSVDELAQGQRLTGLAVCGRALRSRLGRGASAMDSVIPPGSRF